MSLIITETQDAIGTIVMNHTSKRNALSEALIDEITTVLDAFREQGIRAVVLRAPAGSKVWSAGHDVSELPDKGRDPLGWADPLAGSIGTSPRVSSSMEKSGRSVPAALRPERRTFSRWSS